MGYTTKEVLKDAWMLLHFYYKTRASHGDPVQDGELVDFQAWLMAESENISTRKTEPKTPVDEQTEMDFK